MINESKINKQLLNVKNLEIQKNTLCKSTNSIVADAIDNKTQTIQPEHLISLIKSSFNLTEQEAVTIEFEKPEHGCGLINNNFFIKIVQADGETKRIGFLRFDNADILLVKDYQLELELLRMTSNSCLGPKLLFETSNGFCTKCINGRNLSDNAFKTKVPFKLAIEAIGKFGYLSKNLMSEFCDQSGLITRAEAIIASLDLESNKFIKLLGINTQELSNYLDLVKKIDSKYFMRREEMTIIHGDAHPHNLLFSGLDGASNQDIINNPGVLESKENLKCWLIDFELASQASFVYELASMNYLITSFPCNSDLVNDEYSHVSSYVYRYLSEFQPGVTQTTEYVDDIIRRLPYAMLNFSLTNVVVQIQIATTKSDSPAFDHEMILKGEFESFKKLYFKIFGERSCTQALSLN